MPVVNAECSTAEGDAAQADPVLEKVRDLRACAKGLADTFTKAEATLDGDALRVRRVSTIIPYSLSFPPAPLFDLDTRSTFVNPSLSMADGFWVHIAPPTPGEHTLKVLGEADFDGDGTPDFVQDVTYTIDVVPPRDQ